MKMLLFMVTSFLEQSRLDTDSLVIDVLPGGEKCFYHELLTGQTMVVRFQVIVRWKSGGKIPSETPDESINFQIKNPNNIIKEMQFVKDFRFKIVERGSYQICFDNTFSTEFQKFIFFEVSIDGGEKTGGVFKNQKQVHKRDEYKSCTKPLISIVPTTFPTLVHERSQITVPFCVDKCDNSVRAKQYRWFSDTFNQTKCDDEDLRVLYQDPTALCQDHTILCQDTTTL